MTKIEKWLNDYRQDEIRYNLLLCEIDDMTEELCDKLAFPTIQCSAMRDTPFSITNKFHSMTESLALIDTKISPTLAKQIYDTGKDIEKRRNILANVLAEGELFLLSKRYFETDRHGKPYTWAQIAGLYTRHFKIDYIDKDTVKWRIRHKILPKLEEFL